VGVGTVPATSVNTGGAAGSMTYTTGAGGAATGCTTNNIGGAAGNMTFTLGNGGLSTGVTGVSSGTGGAGGILTFTAGNGGGLSGTAPTTAILGRGGAVTLTAGSGTNGATNLTGKTISGGHGGSINLLAGSANTQTGVSANAGNIYAYPGAASGTGTLGYVVLGKNSAGTLRGDIVMGGNNTLTYFGTGLNATITYDGTDLVINPKLVGTGVLSVTGGATLGSASTDLITHTGRMIVRSVTDAGPMTATAGTVAEIVYNTSDSKFYGCTVTGSPATWAALN